MKLKEIVRTVAPALATALGGPLAGSAVRVLSEKFLGKADGTPEEIEAVLTTATPEQLIELKRLDTEFAKHLSDNDIKLEQIDAADRNSAREREKVVKDGAPLVIALVVLALWCWVTYTLLTAGVVEGADDALIGRVLGTLDAAVTGSLWYFLGSSRGSDKKTNASIAAQAAK